MRHGLLGALVLTAALTVGCNNGDPGTNGIEFTDLTTRLGTAYCGYAIRCGTTSFFEQYLLHSTITNCATQTSTFFANTTFAQYQLAIDQGTLIYHSDRAAACLASFDALACGTSSLSAPPPACRETFVGAVADGGACSISEECGTTSFCSASGTTCGVCMHRPQIGESCASLACSDDAWCDAGTCAAYLQAGAACDASAGSCAPGLACTSSVCTASTPGAAGEACGLAGCQTGLVCAITATGAMCRAPRTDGTCQRAAFGSDCPASQTCTVAMGMTDGTCGAYPTMGQACSTVCQAPARCVSSLCQPSTELFQSCTSNDQCLSGICDAGMCQARSLCTP